MRDQSRFMYSNAIIILVLLIVFSIGISNKNISKAEIDNTEELTTTQEIENIQVETETMSIVESSVEEVQETTTESVVENNKRVITESERNMLAKIAFAEAGIEPYETKKFVVMTILNRVDSELFPDTIEGVIFQKTGKRYQFSPIGDGSYKKAKPNDDCYRAVDEALTSTDEAQGALFFECCQGDSWHQRNKEFLFKSGRTKFYK